MEEIEKVIDQIEKGGRSVEELNKIEELLIEMRNFEADPLIEGLSLINRMRIEEKCKKKMKKYSKGSIIGKGKEGTVFVMCRIKNNNRNCNYVVKVEEITEISVKSGTGIRNEKEILKYLNSNRIRKAMREKVVPEFIDYWECIDKINGEKGLYGYLVMEKYTGTLLEYQVKRKEPMLNDLQKEQMERKLDLLHLVGVTHDDIKANNILYRMVGSEQELVFTDFGFSTRSKEDQKNKIEMDNIKLQILFKRDFTPVIKFYNKETT